MPSTSKLLTAAAALAFGFAGAAQAQDTGQPGPAEQANEAAQGAESRGIGSDVRDLAREPEREGGIGSDVRDMTPGRAEPPAEPEEPAPDDDAPDGDEPNEAFEPETDEQGPIAR